MTLRYVTSLLLNGARLSSGALDFTVKQFQTYLYLYNIYAGVLLPALVICYCSRACLMLSCSVVTATFVFGDWL